MSARFRSLKSRFFIILFVIVVISVMMAGLFLYFSWERALRASSERYLSDTIDRTEISVNRNLESINAFVLLIISNPTIQQVLSTPAQKPEQKISNTILVENTIKHQLLFDYAWNNRLIESVFLFSDETSYFSVLRGIPDSNTFRRNQRCFLETQDAQNTVTVFLPENEGDIVYLSYVVEDLSVNRRIGIVVIGMTPDVFDPLNALADVYSGSAVEVCNNKGNQAFCAGNSLDSEQVWKAANGIRSLAAHMINGKPYMVASNRFERFGFSYAAAIPYDVVYRDLNHVIFTYALVAMLVMSLLLIAVWTVAGRLLRPINIQMEAISRVGAGDFTAKVNKSGILEFDMLGEVFNNMVEQIDNLIHEVYEKKLLETEAELKSLQAQINPHFLFNVLESIGWHAKRSGDETVYGMVLDLGKLLRASLYSSGQKMVSLRQELEFVHFYLRLQKVRFEENLVFELFVDESLMDMQVPKLCVECIVENAVVHGLEEKRGQGHLEVRVCRRGNNAEITVSDDGIGFDAQSLNLDGRSESKAEHIGLRNTNRRLKLLYGEEYGICIQSLPGAGTVITMKFPVEAEC